MNKRKIEQLIPIAMNYLADEKNKIVDKTKKSIKSEYNSYLAAFGPSIVQAGILKTLAFYNKMQERKDKPERKDISDFVKDILILNYEIDEKLKGKDLIDIYFEKLKNKTEPEKRTFNSRILEAITACKLAVSTYKIEKD